jgi:hypothetical protein
MTKEVQKPTRLLPEKSVAVARRSAVLAALSFLSASMGLSLNDTARGDPKGPKSRNLEKIKVDNKSIDATVSEAKQNPAIRHTSKDDDWTKASSDHSKRAR